MAARPQVTITLGRSGQKVVKRPSDNFDAYRSDTPTLSGSKRSGADTNAEDSFFYSAKRLQVGMIGRSSGHIDAGSNINGYRVSGTDLRLKLLRKRLSKRIELEKEDRKKRELREKISRTIQSSEVPERFLLSNAPPIRRAGQSLQMESLRTSYSSSTWDGLRLKSPNRVLQISGGMPTSRQMGEVLQLPSPVPSFASRTELFAPSRSKGPSRINIMTASTRTSLDPSKPLKEFPPASSSMLKNAYLDEHLTVSSLLNALGLGKYAIIFQAEEVDMAALKQMGDRDLKELGIPMGPRKKILLAMLAQSKQATA